MTNDLLQRAHLYRLNGCREFCTGHARCPQCMASFAAVEINTIAARLEALSQDTDVDDLVKALGKFCDELRGK